MFIKRFKNINTEMKLGAAILFVYFLWAIGWWFYSNLINGTLSAPYWPIPNMKRELLPPGDFGLMGSDVHGRSIFEIISSGLLYSLGLSLFVSFSSAVIGIIMGYSTVVGPAFLKKMTDLITNVTFIFPGILIAIMVMSVVGQSLAGLAFTLTLTGWPSYARITRGETQRVLGLPYVESAKALGMTPIRLFYSVIFPSILPFILAHFILGVSGVVISESTLGFLGLGGSEYSWGSMLSMGKSVLLEAPYVSVFLSLAMAGLIIGLNLLGDGLRDYLDPKSK